MKTYRIEVTRDGKWWMIALPEIDGLTQARHIGEIESQARSFIAVDQDVAPGSFDVTIHIEVGAIRDLLAETRALAEAQARAAQLRDDTAEHARRLARSLADSGVPLREIGAALGVSYQRADQLVKS